MLNVTIIYAEANAEFAAWLQKYLSEHGYTASLNEEGGDVALIVLSPQTAEAEDVRALVATTHAAGVPLIGLVAER